MIENWNKYKDLEYYSDRYCACGCGSRIKVQSHHSWYGIPTRIYGHITEKTKQLMSKASLGKKKSAEHKKNIGKSRIGTHLSIETREKIKNKRQGIIFSSEWCANIGRALIDKKHSKERCVNKSIKTRKLWQDPVYREKHIKAAKKKWQDPTFREKQLETIFKGLNLKPTKPEKQFDKLLQELFPNEYRYVGDGTVLIGYKNPDFINVNGQKKLIEIYGDYWHGEQRTGRTKIEEENQRINHFIRYGYQTLIIWEYELEDINDVVNKLKEFSRG